jgi:hypothetical protein
MIAALAGAGTGAGTGAGKSNGVVGFSYTNATGKLKIRTAPSLHIYNVVGCAGLISNGDAAQLTASYAVVPRQNIT